MKGSRTRRIFVSIVGLIFVSLACSFIGRSTPTTTPASTLMLLQPTATPPDMTEATRPILEIQSPTPDIGTLIVAYTSQDNVYTWSQGEARQLTSAGDAYEPRISPDGQMVAFLRAVDEFHLELWVIDSSGENLRRLVSVEDLDAIGASTRDPSALAINPYRFRWIPGSRRIAFNTQQVFQGPGLNLLDDLNVVDADSMQIQSLFLSGWGGEFAYSPNGMKVAITQPDKILLSNADGSQYRSALIYDPVTTYAEYRFYAMPVWSPDGTYLMAAIPPVDPLARPLQATEIWRIPADDSPPVLAGSVEAVQFQEQPVIFSPNLERIAFLRETGQPQENLRELRLATIDGLGDFVYAQASPVLFQSWSTDSIRFAYSTGLVPETWIGSLEEAPLAMDPAFNGAQGLRWVDNEQFLFWLNSGDAFELHIATIDGGSKLLDTVFGARPFFTFRP